MVTDCRRTWRTVPVNEASGQACTVNLAAWPTLIWPMSLSSTETRICICARSPAMRNSSGAENEACTVWPGSMLRCTTMPSMGAVMVAYPRFRSARSRSTFAAFTLAREASRLYWAVLNSLSEIMCCSCSSDKRTCSRSAWRCSASARSSCARDDCTAAMSSVLSMRAMTCPALTRSLKSTRTSSTMPLTCVPT